MSVYSGRFLTTTSHGQTLESRPGKAGGLPYVLVRVVFRGAESSSLGPYYEGLLPLLFREHNTRRRTTTVRSTAANLCVRITDATRKPVNSNSGSSAVTV